MVAVMVAVKDVEADWPESWVRNATRADTESLKYATSLLTPQASGNNLLMMLCCTLSIPARLLSRSTSCHRTRKPKSYRRYQSDKKWTTPWRISTPVARDDPNSLAPPARPSA